MKVELTCFLYDKRMADDLGIEVSDVPAKITIDTLEIEAVRQRIADKETEICKKTCMIYTKGGESFVIGKSYRAMLLIWEDLPKQLTVTERYEGL